MYLVEYFKLPRFGKLIIVFFVSLLSIQIILVDNVVSKLQQPKFVVYLAL